MRKKLLTTILLTVAYLAKAQLTVQGDSLISLRGSRILLSRQGFPEQIDSLLAENIHFHFTRQSDGKDIRLTSEGVHFTRKDANRMEWNATSTSASNELQMEVKASLQADGHFSYKVTVTALQDLDMKDITMHIPLRPDKAKELKGLGLPGGPRPDSNYRWKWEADKKGPVGAWIGVGHTGVQYDLLQGNWDNNGNGGVVIGIKGKSMLINNYSGPMNIQKGKSLRYDFDLLITY